MRSQPSIIAAGGAAPAIRPLHLCAMPSRRLGRGVDQHAVDDRGAAHVRDPCSRIEREDRAGSTRRRHTLVPATSAIVQGKHQPLQWNIGSVHRYTGWCGRLHATTLLPTALR
jgi:hypothetical protein